MYQSTINILPVGIVKVMLLDVNLEKRVDCLALTQRGSMRAAAQSQIFFLGEVSGVCEKRFFRAFDYAYMIPSYCTAVMLNSSLVSPINSAKTSA